ncbi:putative alpha 1,4-glycosyltransferase family protein [Senna tora]|uniref:Putative alpha 1,4-glycosyltransferase family protein n=1 Tax=Senna tora TaxID=362788 RepID=A0A834XDH5_9FABA|nr:putative alpha 1,4-glycosyltransferase family protein [Senna tora]
MLRNLRSRRRLRYGSFVCAAFSALLLLLSVSLLYTRLSHSHAHLHSHLYRNPRPSHEVNYDSLLSDSANDEILGSEDKIDALDFVEEQQQEEDDLRTMEVEDDDESVDQIKSSGYFFDHFGGIIRRAFSKRSIEEWDDGQVGIFGGSFVEDRSKAAFGSDDVPVDEQVRRKAMQVMGIEDLLLLKTGRRVSPLREGWGEWFDKKGDFLRKDKMLRSNLEVLNPLHNPLLQDPDGVGLSGFTRGDRIVQKSMLNEFKRVPFPGKKAFSVSRETRESK